MRVKVITRAAVVVCAAAAGIVAVAAPAYAAEPVVVSVVGTELVVTGGPEGNFLILQESSTVTDGWTVTDFGPAIVVGPSVGCVYPDPASTSQLTCVVPGLTRIRVTTGGGEDTVNNYTRVSVALDLGADNDTAFMGGRTGISSTVLAGAGDDVISSGASNDGINGGAGFDTVLVLPFTYPGVDPTLPYVNVAYPVTASLVTRLASRTIDTDAIVQIEGIRTGAGADTLTGDGLVNVLDGGAGNDTITGGAGNDTLRGQGGADVINGGDGDDRMFGGDGDDRMFGDAGTDTLTGEIGFDRCFTGEIVSCEIAAV